MATATKFYCFTEDMAEKKHNLGADTLKWALTNSAPVVTNTVLANITQISTANGYTAGADGGVAITTSTSAQTTGTYKLVIADATLTASGGPIGPFRYAVLYNSTASNDELIQFYDYGSSITLADGETFTFDADATNGVLTVA